MFLLGFAGAAGCAAFTLVYRPAVFTGVYGGSELTQVSGSVCSFTSAENSDRNYIIRPAVAASESSAAAVLPLTKLQILWMEVVYITVDVMYRLAWQQQTSSRHLPDVTVHEFAPASEVHSRIVGGAKVYSRTALSELTSDVPIP
jgi:hypothetical protein